MAVMIGTQTIHFLGAFFGTLAIFFILSLGLTILTWKSRRTKSLRWHFWTGLSALAFLAGTFLHNAFYALNTLTESQILSTILGALEVFFFLLAVPVAPIAFIIFYVLALIKQK